MCYAAKVAKVAGVIIDGMVADVGEIRHYGVPVWCRGLSSITTKRIGMAARSACPCRAAASRCARATSIIADEVGVVVMDPADAEAAADRAIAMQDAEAATKARLDAGEKLPDISGASKVLADALAKQKGSSRYSRVSDSERPPRAHERVVASGIASSLSW